MHGSECEEDHNRISAKGSHTKGMAANACGPCHALLLGIRHVKHSSKPQHYLREKTSHLLLGVGLAKGFLQLVQQVSATQPLHDNDHLLSVVNDIKALHNVGVVQHLEELCLPACTPLHVKWDVTLASCAQDLLTRHDERTYRFMMARCSGSSAMSGALRKTTFKAAYLRGSFLNRPRATCETIHNVVPQAVGALK